MDENMEAQPVQAQAKDQSAAAEAAETGPTEQAAEAAEASEAPERDFAGEVAELTQEFPEAGNGGRLPDEVVDAAVREGKTVVEAYREYALAHAGQDSAARQAQANAARAPVRGVSGGWPVGNQAKDAFLTGFDEE